MLIAQELWYITRGNMRCRKAITVVYRVTPQNGRETVAFLEQGYPPEKYARNVSPQEFNHMVNLPALEVTPSQFRDVLAKRKSIFGE